LASYAAKRFYWSFAEQLKSRNILQGIQMLLICSWFSVMSLKNKVKDKAALNVTP
jgi:high-affinity Fe2+/Pb2+ permease